MSVLKKARRDDARPVKLNDEREANATEGNPPVTPRDYGPFVKECAKRGIGKSRAYQLANEGLLETDYIGKTRVVYLDSLLTLPWRLKAAANDTGSR